MVGQIVGTIVVIMLDNVCACVTALNAVIDDKIPAECDELCAGVAGFVDAIVGDIVGVNIAENVGRAVLELYVGAFLGAIVNAYIYVVHTYHDGRFIDANVRDMLMSMNMNMQVVW